MPHENANKTNQAVAQAKRSIFDPSIIEHRERLTAAKPLLNSANVPFIDMLIPLDNNVKIPIRMYIPRNQNGALPTLFYIPGTAFIASEIKFTRVICSHIAERAHCQVIVINHRLAPENQFPQGYLEAYNVFKFFIKEAPEKFLIDKNRIAIAGYSSGGNFAALMTMQAKNEGISIARQILISPIVDLSRSLTGYKEYEKQDQAISEEFVNFFLNLYIPEEMNPKDPHISPFWEKPQALKGLPKTDIVLAKYDRFRSDAENYYTKLKLAGVDVEKFVAHAEDHSYLWYKLEVIEKIAERLDTAFKPETIHHLSTRHTISYIQPRIKPKQTDTNQEKKTNIPRSKL